MVSGQLCHLVLMIGTVGFSYRVKFWGTWHLLVFDMRIRNIL